MLETNPPRQTGGRAEVGGCLSQGLSECWGVVGSQTLGTVGGVCLSECWGAVGSQTLGTEWGGGLFV